MTLLDKRIKKRCQLIFPVFIRLWNDLSENPRLFWWSWKSQKAVRLEKIVVTS